MIKLLLVTSLLTLAPSLSWATEPFAPIQPEPFLDRWRWRTFRELSDQSPLCIAEDKKGDIWVGTQTGLMRYDGKAWHRLPADVSGTTDSIGVVVVDLNGDILTGTNTGVYRYRAGRGSRVYPLSGEPRVYVRDLIPEEDGSMWIGTNFGLIHLAESDTTFYAAPGYQGAGSTTVPDDAANLPRRSRFHVFDLHLARDGAVWVGLLRGQCFRLDPASGTWMDFKSDPDAPGAQLPRIAETRDGAIWVADGWNTNFPPTRFDGTRWERFLAGSTNHQTSILVLQSGMLIMGGDRGTFFINEQPDPKNPGKGWKEFVSPQTGSPFSLMKTLILGRRSVGGWT